MRAYVRDLVLEQESDLSLKNVVLVLTLLVLVLKDRSQAEPNKLVSRILAFGAN